MYIFFYIDNNFKITIKYKLHTPINVPIEYFNQKLKLNFSL